MSTEPALNVVSARDPSESRTIIAHWRCTAMPRWMLGGHQVPEVRDWPVYAERMVTSFVVTSDDVIRPA